MSIHLAGLDPVVRRAAELTLAWAKHYKIRVTVTSAYRSWAEQTRLRNQYLDCLNRGEQVWPGNKNPACRYPANAPGDSAHNYRWAWDSYVEPRWQDAWDYLRRAAGFTVPQHDRIHAEVPGWRQYLPAPLKRG